MAAFIRSDRTNKITAANRDIAFDLLIISQSSLSHTALSLYFL
jgi:hypothetical protein